MGFHTSKLEVFTSKLEVFYSKLEVVYFINFFYKKNI